jgi:uncharacterized protein
MKPEEIEEASNTSSNPTFEEIVSSSRRRFLIEGGLGAMALTLIDPSQLTAQTSGSSLLGFKSVALTGEDRVIVPPGYTAEVLHAWGDPVSSGPRWDTNALDTWVDQEQQVGMHHDGMHLFPLPYGSTSSERGLLAVNHEYVDNGLLFRDGFTDWSADKVRKAQAAHGVSIVEIAFTGARGKWFGRSTHSHHVDLTSDELRRIRNGERIVRHSSDGFDDKHDHVVTFN